MLSTKQLSPDKSVNLRADKPRCRLGFGEISGCKNRLDHVPPRRVGGCDGRPAGIRRSV
jgi:hypothetical protein